MNLCKDGRQRPAVWSMLPISQGIALYTSSCDGRKLCLDGIAGSQLGRHPRRKQHYSLWSYFGRLRPLHMSASLRLGSHSHIGTGRVAISGMYVCIHAFMYVRAHTHNRLGSHSHVGAGQMAISVSTVRISFIFCPVI